MKTYKLSDLRIIRKENASTVAGNIRLLLACKGDVEKCISLYGKNEQIFMLASIIEQEQGIGQEYEITVKDEKVKRIRKASQDIVLRWFVANQEKANEYKQQTAAKIAEKKSEKKSEKEGKK